jgi:hypothetical protein
VKNKGVNSTIGGAMGGLGGALAVFFFSLWFTTSNLVYLGCAVASFAMVLLVAWILVEVVKVALEAPPPSMSINQLHS